MWEFESATLLRSWGRVWVCGLGSEHYSVAVRTQGVATMSTGDDNNSASLTPALRVG